MKSSKLDSEFICSNCKKSLKTSILFCQNCNSFNLTIDQNIDYFSILCLPITFDIDLSTLDQNYEKQVIIIHPDLFTHSSQEDQDLSLKYSSLLQQAKAAISDPMSRAMHILKTLGINITSKELKPNIMFLQKILDLQEILEEKGNGDETYNKKLINLYKLEYNKLNKIITSIQNKDAPEDCLKKKLIESLSQFKYYQNIKSQIEIGVINH